jgi:hypothetical protein
MAVTEWHSARATVGKSCCCDLLVLLRRYIKCIRGLDTT